jgi:hypothetical protein
MRRSPEPPSPPRAAVGHSAACGVVSASLPQKNQPPTPVAGRPLNWRSQRHLLSGHIRHKSLSLGSLGGPLDLDPF